MRECRNQRGCKREGRGVKRDKREKKKTNSKDRARRRKRKGGKIMEWRKKE